MKKVIKILVLEFFVIFVINGCKKDDSSPSSPYNNKTTAVFNSIVSYGTMSDEDGNVYKTVKIGTQTWMAENLRTTKYNDGTSIPIIISASDWMMNSTTGAYCNYNNTTSADTIATFGRLYNFYSINTNKLCPTGWHVPTDREWSSLEDYLGGANIAGGKLKEIGLTHWINPNIGATNGTGFTALPGGYRTSGGAFGNISSGGYWWSATKDGTLNAVTRFIIYGFDEVRLSSNEMNYGFSVRCVKD